VRLGVIGLCVGRVGFTEYLGIVHYVPARPEILVFNRRESLAWSGVLVVQTPPPHAVFWAIPDHWPLAALWGPSRSPRNTELVAGHLSGGPVRVEALSVIIQSAVLLNARAKTVCS